MASPLLGKIDRCGLCNSLSHLSFSKEIQRGNDKAIDHPLSSWRITGCSRMDHGGKRVNRGCHLREANTIDAAFYPCLRITLLYIMVRNAIISAG